MNIGNGPTSDRVCTANGARNLSKYVLYLSTSYNQGNCGDTVLYMTVHAVIMCNSTRKWSVTRATSEIHVYMAHVHKYMYTHTHIHIHGTCTMYHVQQQDSRSRWLCGLCTQIQTIAVPLKGNSPIKDKQWVSLVFNMKVAVLSH